MDSITGGDCAAAALQLLGIIGGNNDFRLVVTQTGTALSATSTPFGGGPTCSWTGTAAANSVVFNATRCDVATLRVRCANGASRDVQFVSSRITASPISSAPGAIWSGSEAQSYNELVAGTTNNLGSLAFTARFNMNRQ